MIIRSETQYDMCNILIQNNHHVNSHVPQNMQIYNKYTMRGYPQIDYSNITFPLT